MPYGSVNADVITTSTAGGVLGAGNASIMKNRIINGAMVIDQRNAGASVANAGQYTLDRWSAYGSSTSKFTIQQNAGSITPPVGFTNYLGVTSSAATSLGASDEYEISQKIEGYNVADLGWGSANAKTVTLSFWVRSSLTGTFGGTATNATYTYSYPFSYTISSANTWEQKSITITGPTSGTNFGTTNGIGIYLAFSLGAGSTVSGTANTWASAYYAQPTGATSVVGTNGATFYITGVQLEVGSSATGYEYVNYQTSLANCQRYYESITYSSGAEGVVMGFCQSSTIARYAFPIVAKRTAPTMAYSGTLAVEFANGSVTNVTGIGSQAYGGGSVASLYFTVASGLTAGQACCLYANGTAVSITFSSEL